MLCSCAGRAWPGQCAKLSGKADPHHRAVRGRRRGRRAGAPRRRQDAGFDRPARHHREPAPAAGGNVAADAVAKSPPDGYTILQNTNGQAISPSIYKSLPFDPVKDFTPVTQLVASQLLLVATPSLAGQDRCSELIALAKAKPGSLNYGMTGDRQPAAPDHGNVQARRRHRAAGDPLSRRRRRSTPR